MKLNLNYYENDLEYNKYENEETIISNYIHLNKDDNYDEIFDKDDTIDTILALSGMRKNIISWYPFKENSRILEIGAGLGEITGELCNKAANVTSIEFSKKRGEAIAKRHKDKKNLEVIIGNLQDILLEEKFDYVILIGILGYTKNFSMTQKELLQYAKSKLKDNGVILLADDNKFGMQYWTRVSKNGECITKQNRKLFTLKEIEKLLQECEIDNYKTYYVQPDIKLANVLCTKDYLIDAENITRNITYGDKEDIEFYSQNEVYKQILGDNELFTIFANAFFIEIFVDEIIDNKIKMISYSNIRKPEYRIKTVIEGNQVYKYNANCKSKNHIEQIKKNIDIMKNSNLNTLDTYIENKIISQFSNEKTLDKVIIELLKEGNREAAVNLISKFKKELINKLEIGNKNDNVFDKYKIEYEEANIENLHFIKYGLWDLIFQNCFYYNEAFYFYDQEWLEENVPLEFILYRAILYFGKIKQYIPDTEMYEKLGISEEQINLFNKLDNVLQNKIREKNMWKIHTQMQNVVQLKEKVLTIQHERNLMYIDNQKKEQEITSLKQVNEKLKLQLESITNSKSWKIAGFIRGITNKKKGENNENKR